MAPSGEPGSGDADGQWEVPAPGRDLLGRLGRGRDALGTGHPGEQRRGVLRREHVKLHEVRPGQSGQAVARGHQHRAVRVAGQQRSYLPLVRRIVEDHHQPAAGEQRPVPAHALVPVIG